ncbi:bacteriophage tail fiber protein [Yersinia frederiksenii]|uniref:gp53-like domain-containing protein n=1 Tax=Yersinia frederiksenii TaxID=29484 RepID=UPI0005DCCE58|nr:hypothetical protein [Yersinia frederiksenii]CFR10267.1 bacteriophage tail fiber protein [Yersinia frederiksenii]
MHRIDTPTAQTDKFGAGKNGFTRGNPQTGVPATALDDDYFDAIQEEIAGVVESSGVPLDKGNKTQLLTALKKLFLRTSNNFSEIAAAGPAATAAARANLELGNAALKTVGNAAGNIPDMSFFTASNSTNGWQKLPSGLIIQWATSTGTNASGVANTTLPMQFPTAGLCALVTEGSASWAGNYCVVWGINALTTTSVTSVARNVSGTAGPAVIAGAVCKLLAIGY